MDLLNNYDSGSDVDGGESPAASRRESPRADDTVPGPLPASEALASLPTPKSQNVPIFSGIRAAQPRKPRRLKGTFGVPVSLADVPREALEAPAPLRLALPPLEDPAAGLDLLASLPAPTRTRVGLGDPGPGEALLGGGNARRNLRDDPDMAAFPGRDDPTAMVFGEVDDSALDVPRAAGAEGGGPARHAVGRGEGSAGDAAHPSASYRAASASEASMPGAPGPAPAGAAGPGRKRSRAGPDDLPEGLDLSSLPVLEVRADALVGDGAAEAARRAAAAGGVRAALGAEHEAVLRAAVTATEAGKMAKRKHQIGALFHQAKAQELHDLERRATGSRSKAESKSKYGW